MSLRCGIVGLPNVGKSTIFNALTAAGAAAANYPFCTIEPNVGVVALPDERLEKIAGIFQPDSLVPTSVEFTDIAGLVKGASQGEGLGNQFLSHIRMVDAIVHVVRCFEEKDVVHVYGDVNPLRDIEIIDTELLLADLDTITRAVQKVEKKAKSGDAESQARLKAYQALKEGLEKGVVARRLTLKSEEKELTSDLFLLTSKPVLYVANVGEKDILKTSPHLEALKNHAKQDAAEVVVLSGQIEAEIAELPPLERIRFLEGMGLKESGLHQLARLAYRLLNQITFFTAGKKEVRAWTTRQGAKAPRAAGEIHSDFEKGFIRAECYHYNDLTELGSEAKVREAGKIRLEGKDYIVQDGDILFFRFNV